MSKKLILRITLSLLLVSGSFFATRAACDLDSNRCSSHSSQCSLFGPHGASSDLDKDKMTKEEKPATGKELLEPDTDTK
ncbi:MAG: hypothetical protein ABSH41_00525 [Syntrophobacteraceae bacterium]|jgi:hypothetical protein